MVSGGCTRMRAPFEQLKHSAAQSADLLQRVLSFLARQQLPNDSQELDSRFVQIFRSHPETFEKIPKTRNQSRRFNLGPHCQIYPI
jgi:hypothetical protein